MKNERKTNSLWNFDKIAVYDFSNLNIQENSKDNNFGCKSCDSNRIM